MGLRQQQNQNTMISYTRLLRILICTLWLFVINKAFSQEKQKECYSLEKNMYDLKCLSMRSFCDTMIFYSNLYFDCPIWFKMTIQGDLDNLTVMCTIVQCVDSGYVLDNWRWFNNSPFNHSPSSFGVFYHNGYLFEFNFDIATSATIIETLFAKSDSIVTLKPWCPLAKPKYISRKILYPHYCQCLGKLYLKDNKIIVEWKRNSFKKRTNL